MSINSAVRAKVTRQKADADPTAAALPDPVGVDPSILGQLIVWIPTEAIAVYVAILAALHRLEPGPMQKVCDLSFQSRWRLLIGVAVGTFIFVWFWYWRTARKNKVEFQPPVFESFACSAALVAWALALPDTVLQTKCGYNTSWGAAILTGATIIIATIAWGFDKKAPKFHP